MPVSSIFRTDKIVIGSDCTISAVDNENTSPGLRSLVERAAGVTGPSWVGTDKTEPLITFSTPQLATLLGAIGAHGLAVTGNVDTYHKLATSTGNVARATTSHHRVRSASNIAYWSRITLPNSGRATVDVTICPIYDGSNEPLVYTGSVALSGTFATSALAYFQCGPVSINGTDFGAIQEIVIESGAREVSEYAGGEHHPTYRRVDQIEPVVTFKAITSLGFNSPGPAGLALNGTTGLVCYARKIAQNGSRVANATEEHISFTALNGRVILVNNSGTGTNAREETFRVELTSPDDGITTPHLAIDTTAAIA